MVVDDDTFEKIILLLSLSHGVQKKQWKNGGGNGVTHSLTHSLLYRVHSLTHSLTHHDVYHLEVLLEAVSDKPAPRVGGVLVGVCS